MDVIESAALRVETAERLGDRGVVDERAVLAEVERRFDAKVAKRVAKQLKSGARLRVAGKTIAPGASRFGGLPDLPPDVGWPMYREVPMEFVAQLRLAELGSFTSEPIPRSGYLCFFRSTQWAFSDDVNVKSAAASVLHVDAPDDALERTEPPLVTYRDEFVGTVAAPHVYGGRSVKLEPLVTLPAIGAFGDGELLETVDPDEDWLPQWVDEDDHRAFTHITDGDVNSIMRKNDVLLLQLDSSSSPNFGWGDAQALLFVIGRSALEKGALSKARVYCGAE